MKLLILKEHIQTIGHTGHFGELFTSLSCVYCMSYADPAMEEVIHDGEMDESNPFNVVVFHQTNGGAGDDPFHTQDSRSNERSLWPNRYTKCAI